MKDVREGKENSSISAGINLKVHTSVLFPMLYCRIGSCNTNLRADTTENLHQFTIHLFENFLEENLHNHNADADEGVKARQHF